MIKYLLRRTIYKKYDKESQDMLIELVSKRHIIQFITPMFWGVMYILTFIPVFIINICEKKEFSMTTQIVLSIYFFIWCVGFYVFFRVFLMAFGGFCELLTQKLYYLMCTRKGKALSKEDLKTIKRDNDVLYYFIETQECNGYCYSVCFEICKVLKKGSIEFIAMKKNFPCEEEDNDGKSYTMHVLYLNDGWCFDTYSSRQYPIEKFHNINKAKVYKEFSYNEIKEKSYEEFIKEQVSNVEKWANDNDCSIHMRNEEEKKET